MGPQFRSLAPTPIATAEGLTARFATASWGGIEPPPADCEPRRPLRIVAPLHARFRTLHRFTLPRSTPYSSALRPHAWSCGLCLVNDDRPRPASVQSPIPKS